MPIVQTKPDAFHVECDTCQAKLKYGDDKLLTTANRKTAVAAARIMSWCIEIGEAGVLCLCPHCKHVKPVVTGGAQHALH